MKSSLSAASATTTYDAETGYTLTLSEPGYYLVENTAIPENNGAYTAYILQVLGEETLEPKNAKPTVDKSIYDDDTDDATPDGQSTNKTKGAGGYYETADYALYDSFTFKLIATLPASEHYDEYDEYFVQFNDTMSKGIATEEIVSIKVGNLVIDVEEIEDYGIDIEGFDAIDPKNGGSWTLSIADLKDAAFSSINLGSGDVVIEVIYSAHLTEDAIITGAEAKDGAKIQNDNTVTLTYTNNPNTGGKGTTTPDKVYVATYKIKAVKWHDKIDNDNYLDNAKFTLHKGTKDGETVALTWDSAKNAYRPVNEEADVAEKVAEYLVSGGGGAETDGTGEINIIGLDEGTYALVEEIAPAPYNLASPVTYTITATHLEDSGENSATVTADRDDVFEEDILDLQGASLPSTGGIGTTLFYVVGGALVAVAGVTLITKREFDEKRIEKTA